MIRRMKWRIHLLVPGGLLLSLPDGLGHVAIDSELVFFIFLPPPPPDESPFGIR